MRTQKKARHAYRRALEKAVREQAMGTTWRSIRGEIFREQAGWFVSASPSDYINEETTKVNIVVKPMAIDPIFWDLVGLPENRDLPLSFRLTGAWTCRPPRFAELPLAEDPDPSIVAGRLIAAADEQLKLVSQSHSLDAFLATCRAAAEKSEGYLPSLVATLVAMNREDEALAICEEARETGQNGGFAVPQGSFVEMAAHWLRSTLSSATRH
jgi:hypothetical protein